MNKVKISKKGQITIPKDLREKYHFGENVELELIPTPEGILLKSKSHSLRSLRGIFKEINFKEVEEIIKEERKKWKL
ncbi:MAG: AbrB/MazE/SpoVT family DNA-binding domain-containing protein [Candidatus Helarchaeota archaeon]